MSFSVNFPNINPTLMIDCVNRSSLDSRVTFTRASTATLVNSSGVITTAAANVPRFTHDPSTLQPQGLLIEEQRTNSIRNNTAQDAVAGTPGTLPTNWSVAVASGLTTNVIGTGISAGVSYIDLQIVGTSNSTSYILAFESNSQIAALQNQNWSESLWIAHVAGSFANISATSLNIRQSNSAGSQVAATVITLSQPTSTFARVSGTATFSEVTTAFVTPGFRLTITNGAAIDITLRIGLPQLELGAFATSVIPTTTTALTRNADVATMTGTNFSSWYNQSEGTLYAEGENNTGATTLGITSIDDGTLNNRMTLRRTSTSVMGCIGVASGATQWNNSVGTWNSGQNRKAILGYKTDDVAFTVGGASVVTDTSCLIPAVTTLRIGSEVAGAANPWNGTIRSIRYYPVRVSNAQLVALTG
jgi:hypothetical protein